MADTDIVLMQRANKQMKVHPKDVPGMELQGYKKVVIEQTQKNNSTVATAPQPATAFSNPSTTAAASRGRPKTK